MSRSALSPLNIINFWDYVAQSTSPIHKNNYVQRANGNLFPLGFRGFLPEIHTQTYSVHIVATRQYDDIAVSNRSYTEWVHSNY